MSPYFALRGLVAGCALLSSSANGDSVALLQTSQDPLADASIGAAEAEQDKEKGSAAAASSPAGSMLSSQAFEGKRLLEEALDKSDEEMHEFSAKADQLEEEFQRLKQDEAISAQVQTDTYKSKLSTQVEENKVLAEANEALKPLIKGLQGDIAKKRQVAQKLSESNEGLREDLRREQKAMSIAEDFVAGYRAELADDSDAPELRVLWELKEAETKSEEDESKKKRLEEIANAGKAKREPVMLEEQDEISQLGENFPADAEEPEALLKSLTTNLDELRLKEKKGQDELRKRFEASFQVGFVRKTQLLKDKEALTATKASLENLVSRLDAAVAHLAQTHELMAEQLRSMKEFVKNIGEAVDTGGATPHLGPRVKEVASAVWGAGEAGDAAKLVVDMPDDSEESEKQPEKETA